MGGMALPILLFADYNSCTPPWYGLSCFTAMAVFISFAAAWLRLKSGSLWTGTLLHASHNLFVQVVFDPFTVESGRTKWITGEFGIALVITTAVVALIFWSKRAELPESRSTATR